MMYQEEAGRQSVLILFLCTQLKTEASMDFWSFFTSDSIPLILLASITSIWFQQLMSPSSGRY